MPKNIPLYIVDKTDKIVHTLRNTSNSKSVYYNDLLIERIDGMRTFEFEVPLLDAKTKTYLVIGNYIVFKDWQNKHRMFNIVKVEDEKTLKGLVRKVYCEGHYYDLQDSICTLASYNGTDFSQVVTTILQTQSRWQLGTVTGVTLPTGIANLDEFKLHAYTMKDRYSIIQELCKKWECEVDYRVEVSGNTITGRYIDFYKTLGADRGTRLTFSHNTTSIKRTIDVSDIKTAMLGKGAKISINSDGTEEFHDFAEMEWYTTDGTDTTYKKYNKPVNKPHGDIYVEIPSAVTLYGYKWGVYEEDTEDINVLLENTYKALEKASKPLITYDVNIFDLELINNNQAFKISLGDYVTVVDNDLGITASVRVVELRRSLSDFTKTALTLGDVKKFLDQYQPSTSKTTFKKLTIEITGGDAGYLFNSVGEPINSTSQYTAIVYADGVEVVPSSVSWTTTGSLTGTGSGTTFTPSLTAYSTTPTTITVTATYKDKSVSKTISIPVSKEGQIGSTGASGKTYNLEITGGTRSLIYDANGYNPTPAMTTFTAKLYEDGVLVTPTSYSWTTGGVLTGTGSSGSFTPSVSGSYSASNTFVSVSVVYGGKTFTQTVPIAVSKVGTTGATGADGKTYTLEITGGVRSITYNSSGVSPTPTMTAFGCTLKENGTTVTPTAYSWTATGLLSGTSTTSSFTPTVAGTFSSSANNTVSVTVTYGGKTFTQTIPISATKIGATGATGPTGPAGADGKIYVLEINDGVRSLIYDSNGTNPQPTMSAFTCTLKENGTTVTPTAYSWSATGLLSGTSTTSSFTPTVNPNFSANQNNTVTATVTYGGQTFTQTIPIAITQVGQTGATGVAGKVYNLEINNGVRTIIYDANGSNPQPSMSAFSCTLYEDGMIVTPTVYDWSCGGVLTGSSTTSSFTPTVSSTFSTVNTFVSVTVGYADKTFTTSVPIAVTKIGQTGATGPTGPAGANATAYWLVVDTSAIKKGINGVYTPASITVKGFSKTGTNSPSLYAGRFIISETTTTDGSSYTTKYTSSADENTKTYTPSAGITAVKVQLYLAGGTTTLLDEEIIPIVSDGATGPQGPQGPTGATGPQGPQGPQGDYYSLSLTGGTRFIMYDELNKNPNPSTSQQFTATLYKNGTALTSGVTYSWSATGHMSGTSTAQTFTPTIASTYSSGSAETIVSVTLTYNGATFVTSVPVTVVTKFSNIPTGYNLVINSDFMDMAGNGTSDGWEVITGTAGSVVDVSANSPKTGKYAYQNASTKVVWLSSKNFIPIQRDRSYIVEGYFRTVSGSTGNCYLAVRLFDANKNEIAGDGTWWYYPASGVLPPATFTYYSGVFGAGQTKDFPSNAVYMKIGVILNFNNGDSVQQAQGLRIREVIESAYIKDASITNAKIQSLDASKITAGTLTVKDGTNNAKISVKNASNQEIVLVDTNGVTVKNTSGTTIATINSSGITVNSGNITIKNTSGTTILDGNGLYASSGIFGNITQTQLDSTTQTKINNGDSAKSTVDQWKHNSDTTKIDGGKIYTGSITADKIYGGTLTLGGNNNQNGLLLVKNASGSDIIKLDNTGVTIYEGKLSIRSGVYDVFKVDSYGYITTQTGYKTLYFDNSLYVEGGIYWGEADSTSHECTFNLYTGRGITGALCPAQYRISLITGDTYGQGLVNINTLGDVSVEGTGVLDKYTIGGYRNIELKVRDISTTESHTTLKLLAKATSSANRGNSIIELKRGNGGQDIAGVIFGEVQDAEGVGNFFIGHLYDYGNATQNMYISTSPVRRNGSGTLVAEPIMTFTTGGKVGINSFNPSYDFEVYGKTKLDSGGQVLELKAGASADHVFMAFYPDSQAQGTRGGWIGYGSAGSNNFTIRNELNGWIYLVAQNNTSSVIYLHPYCYGDNTRYFLINDDGTSGNGYGEPTLRSQADTFGYVGTSGARLYKGYFSGGTFTSSNRDEKTDIIPADIDQLYEDYKNIDFYTYRYTFKEGEWDYHIGAMVQDLPYYAQDYDASTGEFTKAVPNYEFSALIGAVVKKAQSKIEEQQAYINELEQRLARLEQMLGV